MANPQKENGSTMIANQVLEKLYSFPFTARELKVLLFIIRRTWGWHKKEDKLSYNQIAKSCLMTRRNAIYVIKSLVSKQALFVKRGFINSLQFNKDYDKWVVSKRALGVPRLTLPSVKTGTTIVSKQALELVSKQAPTKERKETITKEITTNVVKEFGNPEINELSAYFLKTFKLPEEDCSQKDSRRYWNILLKKSKQGIVGVKWLIDVASGDDFFRNNITSSKDLYYKRIKLIARKRGTIPKMAIQKEVIAGG